MSAMQMAWDDEAYKDFSAKVKRQREYCDAHPKIDPHDERTWDQTFTAMVLNQHICTPVDNDGVPIHARLAPNGASA